MKFRHLKRTGENVWPWFKRKRDLKKAIGELRSKILDIPMIIGGKKLEQIQNFSGPTS